ncbi:MAG: SDR family oxidoreductase [Spirochaetales bacterium]|jgi:uncharacterized protein|nr:SDR family oxidoreductase [Spirochaetales bacterium]
MAKRRFLSGSWALVTGASAGLGREIATQLAEKGCNIVAASRNTEKLESLKSELEHGFGIKAAVVTCDLSVQGSAEKLHSACGSMDIDINLLINNAGLGMIGSCTEQNTARIEELLTLNILALTTLSNLFAADMKKRRSGYILNIGSLAGFQPSPYFASYAASKSYVFNFTIALHYEMKKHGVSVTCFLPGYIKTDFDRNALISNKRYLTISEKNALPADKTAAMALTALFRNKVYQIAGAKNRLLMATAALLPVKLKAAVVGKAAAQYT